METDDKPFVCNESGCRQRFANEDHLTVHKQKHDMSLNLNTSSKLGFSGPDQTPTPTRFIKNCDEVGLFNDLHVNPFDEQFRRASHSGSTPGLQLNFPDNCDSLNTPCIPPMTGDVHLLLSHHHHHAAAAAAGNSLLIHSNLHQREKRELLISPNEDEEMSNTMPFTNSLSVDDSNEIIQEDIKFKTTTNEQIIQEIVTPKITVSSLADSMAIGNRLKGKLLNQTPVITSVGSCSSYSKIMVRKLSGVPTAVVVKPPPVIQTVVRSNQNQVPIITSIPSIVSSSTTINQTQRNVLPNQQNVQNAAPVVQFILKLPDGQSMPFNFPVVGTSSPQPILVQSNPTTTAQLSNVTKMKLKESLDRQTCVTLTTSASSCIPKMSVRPTTVVLRPQPSSSESNQQSIMTINNNNLIATVQPTMRMDSTTPGRRKRDEFDIPDDEKRRKFLERNRAAATRCRQKRKQWVTELERRADDLEKTNMQLQVRYQSEIAILRNEVAQLKTMLLAHKDCPITQQQLSSGQQDVASLSNIAYDLQSLCPTSVDSSNMAQYHNLSDNVRNVEDYEIIQVETNQDENSHHQQIIINAIEHYENNGSSSENSNDSKSFPGSSG